MATSLLKPQTKRCFSCIQWKGSRVMMKDRNIKTDPSTEGKCLMWQKKTKGREGCDQYTPIG